MSEVSKRDAKGKQLCRLVSTIRAGRAAAEEAHVTMWKEQLEKTWAEYESVHEAVMQRSGPTELDQHQQLCDEMYDLFVSASIELQQIRQLLPDTEKQLKANHGLAMQRLSVECDHWLARDGQLTLAELKRAGGSLLQLGNQVSAIGYDRVTNGATVDDIAAAEEEAMQLVRMALAKIDAHQNVWDAELRDSLGTAAGIAAANRSANEAAGHTEAFRKPLLNIAPFDGSFQKWESFRDSFECAYHNRPGLSNIEKLSVLKGLLRGGPELLIRNLSLTDANYVTAWSMINKRYNHRRELLFSHYRTLFELPNNQGSAEDLVNLSNVVISTLGAVSNMDIPVAQLDSWIVFMICEKLDKKTRGLWEQHISATDDIPTWEDLDLFLQGRVRALSAATCAQPAKSTAIHGNANAKWGKKVFTHAVKLQKMSDNEGEQQHVCNFCHDQHLIQFCERFRRLSVAERRSAIAARGLCFQCMGDGHMASACPSSRRCQDCGQRHNTMLHTSQQQAAAAPVARTSSAVTEPTVAAHTATHAMSCEGRATFVLLATAVIRVRDANGVLHSMRALLDQGSEASFISERAVQLLQLQRRPERGEIVGLGGIVAGRAKQSVQLQVCDRFDGGFKVEVRALVIPKISERAKVTSVRTDSMWTHLKELQLADPEALGGGRIDCLLGSDVYGMLLRDGLDRRDGVPTAQNTWLGWVLSGKAQSPMHDQIVHTHHLAVDDQLAMFWELEETSTKRLMNEEDQKCEEHFERTVSRDVSGRLHVRLPMKVECVSFGETQRFAVQRQLQIERKFKANDKFASMYRAFMAEYEALGHMRKIEGAVVDMTRTKVMQSPQHNEYYIPHHAVMKESSTTTKLRVVFDASRSSTNGVSLNDLMLKGPRLQDDLTATMMRWRTYRFAYCADVQRMYRQIVVDRPDTAMQRIVWRANSDAPMEVFELSTVTYGTTSAPYLAIKSLQTLAAMEKERFPVGANIAMHNFYVDDVLCGGDDEEECVRGQQEIIGLLASGGMALRKWASNSEFVLAQVEESHRECQLPLNIHDDASISTLGIQWHPSADTLGFKVDVADVVSGWTKRTFLSAASRLFDPLGWLAPCIIRVKMLFQTLWKHKLEWDDPLPANVAQQWDDIRAQMQHLNKIRIDRWIGSTGGSVVELHGFCDASLNAYAAVVFARICDPSGKVHVHNLCAKSKVAPVKVVSLPRLELCGAALLVKLLGDVRRAMRWEKVDVHCWTDSTIVLGWLNGHASQYTVFVANRTAEIQRNVPAEQWRHVPSGENPADCVSRGITAEQLLTHKLWWAGPEWLMADKYKWPKQVVVSAATDEIRTRANYVEHAASNEFNLLERYSTLRRVTRVTAWCARFGNNCRTKDRTQRASGPLSPAEHQHARDVWVRAAQASAFADELRHVRAGTSVSKSSSLRSLNPIITLDGILRVGGRLVNSKELTDRARCPAIIPRRSDFSRLLVQDAHEKTLHGGPMLMLSHIRRQYWVVDGPNEVRHYVQKCPICFRHTAKPMTQLMGALPSARVVPSRPFTHCALDYSGAILVRSAKGRGHHATKAYVAVFVCLATKAVHIELAGDLTTAAFIAAYERFTARRGLCTDLYSDNATNFVGAFAIFVRSERELFGGEVLAALATRGTKWHFSPPLSPHFNGLAESAIRSVKHHLKRVVGEATLTFEELSTVLAKIEAVLNSRPIYPLSSDPSDFEALTPAHFLIGEPTGVVPQRDCIDDKIPMMRRWELTQQMVQRFWRRWSADYLHTLQQRRKWQRPQEEIEVDDMVIMLDDNLPAGKWSLGRVTHTHPGEDGHVRVATVRTKTGTYKRAVVRMAKLPNQQRTLSNGTDV